MHFRSQPWLAFYTKLSVKSLSGMWCSQKQRRARHWSIVSRRVGCIPTIFFWHWRSTCGLLLRITFPPFICRVEAVRPKSCRSYWSPQPAGVCDPSHQTFFSQQNLSYKRAIGPYYFQAVPEAQYQDEFYRSCYDLTTGSLTTLSEFGTADGRVDFYIPFKKWGVELTWWTTSPRTCWSFFPDRSVWSDSRYRWVYCARLSIEESCAGSSW